MMRVSFMVQLYMMRVSFMVYDEGFIHVIWGFHSWYKMMVSFIIYGDISFMVYNEDFIHGI